MTIMTTSGKTKPFNESTSAVTTPPSTGKTTVAPTNSLSNFTVVVRGTENSVTLSKLKHFSDYTITVRDY